MKTLTETDWLQIEMAAAGCISGTSDDWPLLVDAISKIRPINFTRSAAWLQGFCEAVIAMSGETK